MPTYPFHCLHDDCMASPLASKTREEIFLPSASAYSESIAPDCPHGHGRMARDFSYRGITNQSKGIFPREFPDMETPEFGDKGPVYCSDYQDYKRKMKERGLREWSPTKNTAERMHIRWV